MTNEVFINLSQFALPETIAKEQSELFSPTTVRHLVRQQHENGLIDAKAIVQVGHKFFIHRQCFSNWFENQTG